MLIGAVTNRRSNAKTAYGLMSDIAEYILEEPKRVFMGNWIIKGRHEIEDALETKGPACGTVGCIAGNALVLRGRSESRNVQRAALELLSGVDFDLGDSLYSLFLGTHVEANYGTKKYARIVATRIKEFQKKHGIALRAVTIPAEV